MCVPTRTRSTVSCALTSSTLDYLSSTRREVLLYPSTSGARWSSKIAANPTLSSRTCRSLIQVWLWSESISNNCLRLWRLSTTNGKNSRTLSKILLDVGSSPPRRYSWRLPKTRIFSLSRSTRNYTISKQEGISIGSIPNEHPMFPSSSPKIWRMCQR